MMKSYKCTLGVLLSAVLFIGSAFAANTLHKDGIAVKDGFNMKGHSFTVNNIITNKLKPIVESEIRDECDDAGGNSTWVGDGWCDSSNNNETCNWDNGDCCPTECYDNVDMGCPDQGGCYAGDGVYDYCGTCATCDCLLYTSDAADE